MVMSGPHGSVSHSIFILPLQSTMLSTSLEKRKVEGSQGGFAHQYHRFLLQVTDNSIKGQWNGERWAVLGSFTWSAWSSSVRQGEWNFMHSFTMVQCTKHLYWADMHVDHAVNLESLVERWVSWSSETVGPCNNGSINIGDMFMPICLIKTINLQIIFMVMHYKSIGINYTRVYMFVHLNHNSTITLHWLCVDLTAQADVSIYSLLNKSIICSWDSPTHYFL